MIHAPPRQFQGGLTQNTLLQLQHFGLSFSSQLFQKGIIVVIVVIIFAVVVSNVGTSLIPAVGLAAVMMMIIIMETVLLSFGFLADGTRQVQGFVDKGTRRTRPVRLVGQRPPTKAHAERGIIVVIVVSAFASRYLVHRVHQQVVQFLFGKFQRGGDIGSIADSGCLPKGS